MGSNITQGMDVCLRLFCMGSSFATGWFSIHLGIGTTLIASYPKDT
jgi:hypothetical protein